MMVNLKITAMVKYPAWLQRPNVRVDFFIIRYGAHVKIAPVITRMHGTCCVKVSERYFFAGVFRNAPRQPPGTVDPMGARGLDWVKAVVITIFGFGAVALFVIALLTPWYTFTSTYTSGCFVEETLSWEVAETTCAISCNATVGTQSCNPLVTDTNWLDGCNGNPNYCYWQNITFQVCRAFAGAAAALVPLALIMYFISFCGKMSEGFGILCLILGFLAGAVAVATMGVGLPMAILRDYVTSLQANNSGVAADTACPQDLQGDPTLPGCDSFIGSFTSSDRTLSWGPATGWILALVGAGILLVDSILMCILGVPKRDKK